MQAAVTSKAEQGAPANVYHDFGSGISAGAGASWVADREDVHASTFAMIDGGDYFVARVYASWEINSQLTLTARIENLLDESYEQVHGYPQPGTGIFGGVQWKF